MSDGREGIIFVEIMYKILYFICRPHSTKLFAGPGYFPPTSYTEDYGDPHTKSHYKPKDAADVRNNPHPTEVLVPYTVILQLCTIQTSPFCGLGSYKPTNA